MIRADQVSDQEAFKYYSSHLSDYRKAWPEYILDIILADSLKDGNDTLAKLKEANKEDKEDKEALFARYQKELKSVSSDQLPVDCRNIIPQLKPARISPVIPTQLGYFILRLKEKQDPAYLPFETVKLEIKSLLPGQQRQKDERDAQLYVKKVEEEALARVYQKANVFGNIHTVSDEEADKWWKDNKNGFLRALGLPDSEIQNREFKFADPRITEKFKKVNLLSARYTNKKQNLYAQNDVVIYEELLKQ
jgi:hypothetical protein